jgi:hypothetical protein
MAHTRPHRYFVIAAGGLDRQPDKLSASIWAQRSEGAPSAVAPRPWRSTV